MPGVLLWGWDSANKVWREVIVDSSGRINIGSVADAEISQDTPQSLKHVPHGYYAAGPSYLPLKVKSDGTLCLEIASLPKLDDISDVDVPSPTDGYVLYWDAATSLWKCKALVDADIPAAIARDTEVATAVSDHAAIAAAHFSNVITITFIIDGGGSAITTGQKGHLEIPFACTLTAWTLMADVAGAIVIDVWRDSYANFPPTNNDAMPGAGKEPTIAATNQNAQDLDIADWTTKAIAAGDILAFNVDSCTTITRVTLSLKATKV